MEEVKIKKQTQTKIHIDCINVLGGENLNHNSVAVASAQSPQNIEDGVAFTVVK